MSQEYPDATTHGFITASAMLATVMVAIDGTVANVALPHIQSSVAASQDQIVWVLTSYLIASAIAMPLSGWLANRYGRKYVMLLSVAGFTLASLACGASTNLYELVVFRMLQGMCGACVVPLSQATLLDINPPEKHGQAMAIDGIGSMFGPIVGPALGGFLTDALSWRWVFLINLPFGIVACLGIFAFTPKPKADETRPVRFDMMGFAALSIFLATLQLMLDRGQQLDWFSSPEICIEATLMAVSAYITVVHMFTARDPFLKPALFRDRNFVIGSLLSMLPGMLVLSISPLLSTMLQQLLGYPVLLAGSVTVPRGVGTAMSMLVVGRLVGRVNTRYLVISGLVLCAISYRMMAGMSLEMTDRIVLVSGFIQGLGSGMFFVPLSTLVFSTVDSRYRNEGASLYALTRNMGTSAGISLLQTLTIRNVAAVQSRLTDAMRPDNPLLQLRVPDFDFALPASVAAMEQAIVRQASMVAYVDTYWLLYVLSLATLPLTLLLRVPKRSSGPMADIMPMAE